MARTKTISYSEIDCYRQCPLKHQLSYLERWASTEPEAEALGRGTLFHLVMETHYGVVQDWQRNGAPQKVLEGLGRPAAPMDLLEAARAAVGPLLVDENGDQTERQELVQWLYDGYTDLYGIDEDWRIEQIELPLEAWLPTANGGRSTFKLAGTADLVVRDMSAGGGLWIVDHKTCKNLPRQKDFDMEDQTAIYTYLLRQAGYDIRGAIYNHCRTQKLKTREMVADERFKRTITVRGEQEIETMALEALDEMREAYRKRPDGRDARRRPDGERCGWKCGFTEPCLAARKKAPGALPEIMRNFGFEVQEHKPGPTFQNRAKAGKA